MTDVPASPRTFRRRGLGRGLEALLAGGPDESGDAPALVSLDPHSVSPNPEQPRKTFDDDDLAALGESIRVHGLLHPIVVERVDGGYRLVAGERRLRAASAAGVASIPAIVRPPAESARHWLEMALTENVQRTDLNPMDEAAAYGRLADTFGMSHEAIAMRLGKSRPAVSNTIRLLGLPASVQEAVAGGRLTAGHARAILAVNGDHRREALADRVIAEGLSVRETERATQNQPPLALAPAAVRGAAAATRPTLSPDDEAFRRNLEYAVGLPLQLRRKSSGGGQIVIDFTDNSDLDALHSRFVARRR
ncbi:MAG: ParB/RepB/Spo0J family partition protein [Candidatus Dormibacteria bacterium]